jgi:hypothetical protein
MAEPLQSLSDMQPWAPPVPPVPVVVEPPVPVVCFTVYSGKPHATGSALQRVAKRRIAKPARENFPGLPVEGIKRGRME